MHPHRLGIGLGAQLAASVLEVANQFFLLRVDRAGRLACGLKRIDPRVDVFELRVAVGMAGALAGLAVRLQAEAQMAQQPSNQLLAGGEAAPRQRTSEMTLAFANPQQRCLRVATDRRLHEVTQRIEQPGLSLGLRLASAARTPNTQSQGRGLAPQVRQATPDRAARNAGRLTNRSHPATACRVRLTGHKQPTRSLVQVWRKCLKARPDACRSDHLNRLVRQARRLLAPRSFVPPQALRRAWTYIRSP